MSRVPPQKGLTDAPQSSEEESITVVVNEFMDSHVSDFILVVSNKWQIDKEKLDNTWTRVKTGGCDIVLTRPESVAVKPAGKPSILTTEGGIRPQLGVPRVGTIGVPQLGVPRVGFPRTPGKGLLLAPSPSPPGKANFSGIKLNTIVNNRNVALLEKKEANLQVVKKLNELVPKPKLIIKKNSDGYFVHPETSLVFDKPTTQIIGRWANGKVNELTEIDIEKCKEWNFKWRLPETISPVAVETIVQRKVTPVSVGGSGDGGLLEDEEGLGSEED